MQILFSKKEADDHIRGQSKSFLAARVEMREKINKPLINKIKKAVIQAVITNQSVKGSGVIWSGFEKEGI